MGRHRSAPDEIHLPVAGDLVFFAFLYGSVWAVENGFNYQKLYSPRHDCLGWKKGN